MKKRKRSDFVIENDGNIEELKEKIDKFLEYLETKCYV